LFEKTAKRVAPEALAFLRSALLLFATVRSSETAAPASSLATENDGATPNGKKAKKTKESGDGATDVVVETASLSSSSVLGPGIDLASSPLALPTFADAAPLGLWLRTRLQRSSPSAAALSLGPAPQPGAQAVLLTAAAATSSRSTAAEGSETIKAKEGAHRAKASKMNEAAEPTAEMKEVAAESEFAASCLAAILRLVEKFEFSFLSFL